MRGRGGGGGRGYAGGGHGGGGYGGHSGGRQSANRASLADNSPYNSISSGVGAIAPGRCVYVGNLSFDVGWQDLKDHFKSCGNVVRADIMLEAGGRSKGCGLVQFSNPEEAQLSIASLNDTDLKGRTIFVREDRESSHGGAAGTAAAAAAGRRLYVGNLSYDVAWYDLKDHFKSAGNVVRADVLEEAGGRSKGCGLVEFATAEEAQEAIASLNDSDLKGRTIFVREDRETNSAAGSASGRRLYVGNLSYDVAWYDLKDHFKSCGNVVRADVMEEAGGRSKGCGLVEFSNLEEAQLAIASLNDSDLKGRTIFVREDREMVPSFAGNGYNNNNSNSNNNNNNNSHFNSHNLGYSGGSRGGSSVGGGSYNGGSSSGTGGVVGAIQIGVRVYVGNLSWEVSWPQLKEHFKTAGEVVHADVPVGEDGRSKGYGVVEFKYPKDALFAIHTLQGTLLSGRPVKLREYGDS